MSRPAALFAYGTLMFAPVLRAVCGIDLPTQPARLRGYARFEVAGAAYPAMIAASEDATLDGVLYTNVTPALWRVLDAYEGTLYRRIEVTVRTPDGADAVAGTYVIAPGEEHRLTAAPWVPSTFAARDLADYLARI